MERIGYILHFNKRIGMAHVVEKESGKRFVFKLGDIKNYSGEYPEELKRFGRKGLIDNIVVKFQTDEHNFIIENSIEPLNPKPEVKYSELTVFSLFLRNLRIRWYEFKYKFIDYW